ncbi:cytochrome c oxidase assembly factor 1 family protein [Myxococcus sp. K15C18031901]|uniref:cytochrome c oxidase assembly factor Coa1 family protein n=1 Tax=Myxococcus dinghuensis TaxID=2906761 RepID=UPI0020A8381A|nr:cytochrome c oxidase assembly factor Coa1 family protein [Myxococcus dinghuensis]MCP3101207.1 cytochrome c oxidase assembly factor 1 family protein [Myxococcus dinghuensis]
MDATPEGSLVPQQGWWSRNWKWVVPAGCLGLVAMCGCLGFALVGWGVKSVGTTGANVYTEAVGIARMDAQVRSTLGSPIEAKLPRQTSVQTVNGVTRARLDIPLDGPQADGVLHVDAEKTSDGDWRYRTLDVELENGTRLDLRSDAEKPDDEAAPEEAPAPEDDTQRPPPTGKPDGDTHDIEL